MPDAVLSAYLDYFTSVFLTTEWSNYHLCSLFTDEEAREKQFKGR